VTASNVRKKPNADQDEAGKRENRRAGEETGEMGGLKNVIRSCRKREASGSTLGGGDEGWKNGSQEGERPGALW